MEVLTAALFLSVVANRIVDALVEPIRKRYPDIDLWWLIYVTWVFGGALSWLAGANLFADLLPDTPMVGMVLSAILVGGGANLIHDVFDK